MLFPFSYSHFNSFKLHNHIQQFSQHTTLILRPTKDGTQKGEQSDSPRTQTTASQ